MLGKQKCKMLREIRQRIAEENDIPYITKDCTYQGECRGTCPKCESELRYLEGQLAARQRLGKVVTVTALCASLVLAGTGCGPDNGRETALSGMMEGPITTEPQETPEVFVETGEVAWPEETQEPEELPEAELSGDVAWEGENGDG